MHPYNDSIRTIDFFNFLFENDFKAILPELFLVFSSILLLIYGVVYSTSTKNPAQLWEKKQSQRFSVLKQGRQVAPPGSNCDYPLLLNNISLLSLLSFIFTFFLFKNNFITHATIFYNTLVIDNFTYFLKILIIFSVCFCILISLNYMKKQSFNAFEYMILVLLSTISMLFLISSYDFISMYLAIELQSLCFYVMCAASARSSEFSTEAGLKYFLLGAFSSGILLFGISLIYGFTGITNFSELTKIFACGSEVAVTGFGADAESSYADNVYSSWRACELGMIFILVGFLFKLTAVPFHMWAPDVYEGVPTSVTAFFSITPKISILAIVIKVFTESFYDFMFPWQKILIFSSICSMIYASFAAMSQNKIKRLLAFSSIGHVGYLLIGICCGTTEGLQALFLYLVVYIVMTINIFAIILSPLTSVIAAGPDKVYTQNRVALPFKYTTDLTMLSKTNSILALTFTVTLFSIAGIPPLAGFYSKAFLFFAAMSSTMYLLAIVGVVTSVISCFYYIRLVKIMYFDKITLSSTSLAQTYTFDHLSFAQVKKENAIVLALSFFFILFFMLFPTPLYLISHKFALFVCY